MDDMIKALNCIGYYEKEMCYKDAHNIMRKDGDPKMICGGDAKENQIKCPYCQKCGQKLDWGSGDEE